MNDIPIHDPRFVRQHAQQLFAEPRLHPGKDVALHARVVLGLKQTERLTKSSVQAAWRTRVKVWHPDLENDGYTQRAKGQMMRAINVSRDLLLSELEQGNTKSKRVAPRRTRKRGSLLITPEGHIFGNGDLYLGSAGSVAFAIAYCGRAGWKYELCNQLSEGQQTAISNRPKPRRRRRK